MASVGALIRVGRNDPFILKEYKIAFQNTVTKIVDLVSRFSMSVLFNSSKKSFIIENSKDLSHRKLIDLLMTEVFEFYYPIVLEETDEQGNKIVRIKEAPLSEQLYDSYGIPCWIISGKELI